MEKEITTIIHCADIHVPALKGLDELKETLQAFINSCKRITSERGAEHVRIVICGDIFHAKIAITNESILCVNWFFGELDKICKTYVIAGNHDLLMNNIGRVDSLTPIFEIGNFKQVIYLDMELGYQSGIYEDENVAWCLYSSFSGFATPDIAMHKASIGNGHMTHIGLIHADVNGAITATNRVTENGIDPGVFDECDFVAAGHIHKRQLIKKNGIKIAYASSIRQMNMGETITSHGYVLWDIEDCEDPDDIECKFVDIPDAEGGYYKFEVNGIDDIDNDNEELLNY